MKVGSVVWHFVTPSMTEVLVAGFMAIHPLVQIPSTQCEHTKVLSMRVH
jgi:hypothetical protein